LVLELPDEPSFHFGNYFLRFLVFSFKRQKKISAEG